jgi:protein-S-isoprenylcysteine O-methyltransferase Ste14
MITAQYIILACWIIFLLYWFVTWSSVKPTQERTWSGGSFRWVIIGVVAIIVLFLKFFGLPIPLFTISLISHSELLSVVSVILVGIGLVIALVARGTLAGNWSQDVDIKVDHELITTGVYRYARHPIYTGVLLMGLGSVLLLGTLSGLLGFLFLLGFFLFKVRREEKLLTQHFPKEYPVYKNHTKALIPFVW